MMAIPPSEAKQLTLAEYDGLMHNWNLAHTPEDQQPIEPPSREQLEARKQRLEAKGIRTLY